MKNTRISSEWRQFGLAELISLGLAIQEGENTVSELSAHFWFQEALAVLDWADSAFSILYAC